MKASGLLITIAALALGACTHSSPSISRTHHFPWEGDIGYTQVVEVGNHLYLSGITSPEPTLERQLAGIYQTIEDILAKHGVSMDDIIKEVVYTTDIESLKTLIPQRRALFSGEKFPASTWVEVERLFMPKHQIEIEVIAIIP